MGVLVDSMHRGSLDYQTPTFEENDIDAHKPVKKKVQPFFNNLWYLYRISQTLNSDPSHVQE